MYLNVWQPRLQHGAGAAAFFTSHRGHAYASTALMDPMTKAFVADIHHFTGARGVDLVHFGKERKDEVTQRYLAEFTGTEGVLYAGRAQEKATVWRTQRRYHADGSSYAWLVKTSALVNYFYFYCVDADFGPFFIKFCTCFPYTAKLCINGHEWAKRQAARAGISFEPLDNGFAAGDAAALQAICDRLGPPDIDALLRKWLRILPHPFTAGDTKIKQYHKLGRALRTETTINDAPADFGIPKRLTSLPDLRQIGFTANRRLLGVQTISHDPIAGARAFTALTAPLITPAGTRIPGLRFGDPRVHALLQALLIHRLLPRGFTNRELRTLIAPLLGTSPEEITAGKMT